jgi:deoxyribodipyrimidine photo-lyase
VAAPLILCFRRDLRLADQPALAAALAAARAAGAALIPVFVHEEAGDWPPGAASRWWLHHSLAVLDADLRARGSRLLLRPGPLASALAALQAETGAAAVYATRRVEPAAREAEGDALRALAVAGAELRLFTGDGLHAPDRLRNAEGGPYRVFTPFWKALAALPAPAGLSPAPAQLPAPATWPASLAIAELALLPRLDWAGGLRAAWTPGEAGAQAALVRFMVDAAADYATARDLPGRAGVSRLSPHLHFGEIAPARLWAAALAPSLAAPAAIAATESWRRQLAWRDFARHLLWHFPGTRNNPLDARFERFPWRADGAARAAWQRGETGYPLVDAGMRELWSTGWMHNRVRMVAASFLTKHLLIDWRAGARWF